MAWVIEAGAVTIAPWLVEAGPDAITAKLHDVTRRWYESGKIMLHWRGEKHRVFGPLPDGSGFGVVFELERRALRLFGVQCYGVGTLGYQEAEDGMIAFWLAKRSAKSVNWPGKYDILARGGLQSGQTRLEGMLAELDEEASIRGDFARASLASDGHWFASEYTKSPSGVPCVLPHVEYVYQLRFANGDPTPQPNDGSIERFELVHEKQVLAMILNNEICSWIDLYLLDFLWRQKRLDLDPHPYLLAVINAQRRAPLFPGPE